MQRQISRLRAETSQAGCAPRLRAEDLAGWYLRLNGFLTIPNFIVHCDEGYGQRTEADVLAIRFPCREEIVYECRADGEVVETAMQDDTVFVDLTTKPCLLITEVKTGVCSLNDKLIDPALQNVPRILRAVGLLPREEVAAASDAMYRQGFVDHDNAYIAFCCVGTRVNRQLFNRHCGGRYYAPAVPQITFEQIAEFMHIRFAAFKDQKACHVQWGSVGRKLWELFGPATTRDSRVEAISDLAAE